MILCTDNNGNVLLVGDGIDPSKMPTEFNGAALTASVLTDAQEAVYLALPANRGGTTLIAGQLAALPALIPPIVPNASGFIAACKTALGGPTGIRALPLDIQSAIQFTLFAISLGDWPGVQAYITPMEIALGTTTYAAIKSAAAQNNIPITL